MQIMMFFAGIFMGETLEKHDAPSLFLPLKK